MTFGSPSVGSPVSPSAPTGEASVEPTDGARERVTGSPGE